MNINQSPQSLEARKHRAKETIKSGMWEGEFLKVSRRIPANSIAAEEFGFLKRDKLEVVLATDKRTPQCEYDTLNDLVEDGWRPEI